MHVHILLRCHEQTFLGFCLRMTPAAAPADLSEKEVVTQEVKKFLALGVFGLVCRGCTLALLDFARKIASKPNAVSSMAQCPVYATAFESDDKTSSSRSMTDS
mmetsp:Transcript_64370/g.188342  ORF Transcript_64370/g.188342 Transcript_64370/m.188342 type:complete len:103 (+) Transcript_64370:27-335(+)